MKTLKEILIEAGIVKIRRIDEDPFTLKSGKKSRLFFDVKEASLNPAILKRIIDEIDLKFVKTFDIIASVAVSGVPIATALSLRTGIPQIIIRSEKHDRGMETKIIGDCKDKKVILVEDVASSGGSLVEAIKEIHVNGGICSHCIVIIHRQEGASDLCGDNEIFLHQILTKSDFLKENK